MSNMDEALRASGIDPQTLQLLIALIREHYEQTGNWPTAVQLRALLLKPS